MKNYLFRVLPLLTVVISVLLLFTACGHDHMYGEWTIEKEATCVESGSKFRVCECGEKQTETIEAKGHTNGEWVTDADSTCTENGSKHQVCSVCAATIKTETIEAKGHTNGEWVTDVDATCTENGSKHQVCSVCAATIKTETIEAKGHTNGEWVTDVDATCTENGSKHQVCSVCTATIKTETIASTGHKFINLKCSNCDGYSVETNEIGKSYTDKNGLTVTLNSYTITEYEGYYSYSINYTIENKVPDSKLMPGSFKLFFTDKTGENQYGGFNYLYYGEKSTRSYTWKVLKTQTVLILEYNADDEDAGLQGAFFRDEPIKDTMHWVSPEISKS